MELVMHLALVVAAVAHGAALLARAEAGRLHRQKAIGTVHITITADVSAFQAAVGRARQSLPGGPA